MSGVPSSVARYLGVERAERDGEGLERRNRKLHGKRQRAEPRGGREGGTHVMPLQCGRGESNGVVGEKFMLIRCSLGGGGGVCARVRHERTVVACP